MTEDNFYSQNLYEENKIELQRFLLDDKLLAIVDESKGGIIGYIISDHIEELVNILNKSHE